MKKLGYLYITRHKINNQHFFLEEIGPGTAQGRLRVTPSRPATRTDTRSVSYRALFPVPSSLSGGGKNGGCRLQNASRFNLINYIGFVFRKIAFRLYFMLGSVKRRSGAMSR